MRFPLFLVTLLLLAVVGLALPATSTVAQANDGLIAHWKLDEGTGTAVADSSGNGYDGALGGDASWSNDGPPVPGANGSVKLSGSGYIDTAAFDINDDFTIAAWINPDESYGRHNIIGKYTDGGQNQLLFGLYDGNIALNIRDSLEQLDQRRDGEWVHVLLAARGANGGTEATLYHNGVPQWTYQLDEVMGDVSGGKPWTIGRDWDPSGANDYFLGLISDVRIYDRALDDEEIAALTDGFAVTCDASDPLYRAINNAYDQCDIINIGPFPRDLVFEDTPNRGLIFEGAGREKTTLIVEEVSMRFLNLQRHTSIRNLTVRWDNYPSNSGQGGFLNIAPRVEVILEGVGFENGYAWFDGGAIHNEGILTIRDGLFDKNIGAAFADQTDRYNGGAINNEGVLSLYDTVFSGNFTVGRGNHGGTIANSGDLSAENITISDSGGDEGGAIYNTGTATIKGSQLLNNKAGGGGAIYNTGTLTIENSRLAGNETYPLEGGRFIYDHAGGAILNTGTASVIGSELTTNNATNGGAVLNRGALTVSQSTVSENTADREAGAFYNRGTLRVEDSLISDNGATHYAGAFYNREEGEVTISGSTISGNHVSRITLSGSAIFNRGIFTARNSTISGNYTPNPTGSFPLRPTIRQSGSDTNAAVLQLIHTTLAGNGVEDPEFERGIYATLGTVLLKNSLLANNGAANCVPLGPSVIIATGTLADDDSCDGVTQSANMRLSPAADNGGPTPTMAIGADSDARDAGETADCEEFDQRGIPRDDGACDAGAYEFTPGSTPGNRILLPLVRGV